MNKKALILLLLTLIPVYFALLGFMGPGDAEAVTHTKVKALLVNPFAVGMLGGITAIVLQHRRSMWWSMIVTFFYTWLGFGLVWGTFFEKGVFDMETMNLSAMFAVIGFVCAAIMHGFVSVLKRAQKDMGK